MNTSDWYGRLVDGDPEGQAGQSGQDEPYVAQCVAEHVNAFFRCGIAQPYGAAAGRTMRKPRTDPRTRRVLTGGIEAERDSAGEAVLALCREGVELRAVDIP